MISFGGGSPNNGLQICESTFNLEYFHVLKFSQRLYYLITFSCFNCQVLFHWSVVSVLLHVFLINLCWEPNHICRFVVLRIFHCLSLLEEVHPLLLLWSSLWCCFCALAWFVGPFDFKSNLDFQMHNAGLSWNISSSKNFSLCCFIYCYFRVSWIFSIYWSILQPV